MRGCEGTASHTCTHAHGYMCMRARIHTHTYQESCPGHKIGRPHLEKRHFASFHRTDYRQHSRKGTGRMVPSQGLPEYSTGKSGAAPTQLQVKDPRVLRQAVPGSQSSSLLSHSSKSVRHFGNKTDLLSGLRAAERGTLPAVYRQLRGKRISEKVKNYPTYPFWRQGWGGGRCQRAAGAVLEEFLVPGWGWGRRGDIGQSSVRSEQPGGEHAPPNPWSQAGGPTNCAQLLYVLTVVQVC